MKDHHIDYIRKLLLPCVLFSAAAGVFSAILITLFQWAAHRVIHLSEQVYAIVRDNLMWLPCLVIFAAILGLASSFILSRSQSCRGGGIPTSIAAIRGITAFKWFKSISLLPFSALLTFLCGLPLGTEGPCVQMGTAVGDGVVHLFGKKKHIGWRRYIMTGGAAAGFSLATGAPITAILFSVEELHKRFSPLLFSVASLSVLISQITARILARFGIGSVGLFHLSDIGALDLKLFFVPLVLGLLCGISSIWFTRLYHKIDKTMRITLGRIPRGIKFPLIFVCVALIGVFFSQILGTGHALVEELFAGENIWYLLIIVFLVRAVFMMVANTAGITGGIFLPTLAFGALIGALCAEIFSALGIISGEHYMLLVVLGMTAFLGASSRIPVTACVFAIEALCGIQNTLPIIIAVTTAFLSVEISGLDDFTDTVIEAKAHAIHKGLSPQEIEVPLTVCENAFVIGKELSDILWPVSCVVLSIQKGEGNRDKAVIEEGDVLTVHYKTYDPYATAEEFEVLVGDQTEAIDRIMRP